MRFPRKRGSTSVMIRVFIPDNSVTNGAGVSGLTSASTNLAIAYSRELQNGATQITGANIVTITTIGTWANPGTGKLGFKAVDATNLPGVYEIHFPDDAAAFGTGDTSQAVLINVLELTTTALHIGPCALLIPLVPWDYQDGVRMGLTALPNAAAEAAGGLFTRGTGAGQINQDANGRVDANVKTWISGAIPAVNVTGVPIVDDKYILGTIYSTPATAGIPDINVKNINNVAAATPGAAGGVFIAGTNAATTITGSLTTTFTGNLTGSAASVTAGVTVTTNNDKTGYGLSAAAVQAIWDALTSALTTVGSVGKLLIDNINATISSRSTYAGTDTSGTTTLLSRIASALTITGGKVDVNDKTGFSLTQAFPTNFSALGISAGGHVSNVDTLTTYTGDTPQTGDSFARLGAAGAGLTALGDTRIAHLDADVSTRATPTNITAGTITTVTNLTNAASAGDFTAAMKTSLNAATPAVTVSDKTGFSLSAAGVQAIWDALTSALTTVGSIGKLLVDNITGNAYTRLGAPAGASISADIAAAKSDTAAVKVQTDKLAFTVTNQIDANVLDWKSATAPAMSGDAFARLGAPAGASVSADVAAAKVDTAAIKAKTDNLPSDPADASDILAGTNAIYSRIGAPVGASISADIAAVQADTDNIQTRLPAALVSGRIDASVGAMAAGVLTATAIAADAITDAKVASDVTIASVTGAVGSVTGNIGGNVVGSIGSLGATAKSDVNAEVVDVLATDTYAEPGQGAPAATASIAAKINYLYKAWRNKKTQTSTTFNLFADDATTVDHTATASDDLTTFTFGEIASGP